MKRKRRVLFFSRGLGYGHAVPDVAISEALVKIHPQIEPIFASYATGARALRELGVRCHDLDLAEENPFFATLFKAIALIRKVKPDAVLSHEEFAVLVAAFSEGVSSIYLADWLPPEPSIASEALCYANRVILMENPGVFAVPVGCSAPRYLGPMAKQTPFDLSQKNEIRSELNIAANAYVVVVAPGGRLTESQEPIAELVFGALKKVRARSKVVLWVSSKDYPYIATLRPKGIMLRAIPFYSPLEKLMVCSDVVLTKGTRNTTLEASRLGVPSISLSRATNAIDEILVPRISTNVALNLKAASPAILGFYLEKARGSESEPNLAICNESHVATALGDALASLSKSPVRSLSTSGGE